MNNLAIYIFNKLMLDECSNLLEHLLFTGYLAEEAPELHRQYQDTSELCGNCGAHKANYKEMMGAECCK